MNCRMLKFLKQFLASFFYCLLLVFGFSADGFSAPPTVSILLPADGSSHNYTDSIDFLGQVDSVDVGATIDTYQWTSSRDNVLSDEIGFSSESLSIATHVIRFYATDSNGARGFAEITIDVINDAPSAVITAPGSGGSYAYGASVTFTGSGTDTEDDLQGLPLSYAWSSDINGVIGTGTTVTTTTLSSGTHTIKLTVTDSQGATGTTTITLTVKNGPPVATITAPADNSSYAYGAAVTFEGTGQDPQDGALSGSSLVWTSSLESPAQIGTGKKFSTSSLTSGIHTITLTVTDLDGSDPRTDTDTISLTIRNAPPQASITAPASGSTYTYGDTISFTGTGTDIEDDGAGLPLTYTWSSDINGVFGSGTSPSTSSLSSGSHNITLTVTDSEGDQGTAKIVVIVSNPAPTATIDGPADNASFDYGEEINFQGTGYDPEEGDLTGSSLVWTSSQGDPMGTGETLSITTLTSGQHTITLTVTDSKGASAKDTITITVGNAPPTANISAPADNTTHAYNSYITFKGTGTDPEDGTLSGSSLVWTSSLASPAQIGTGTTFSINTLPSGTQTITLTVTDKDATDPKTAFDTITITVTNADPTAVITAPANNSSHAFGSTITFTGTGTDPEDGTLTGDSLVWSSNIDGILGYGISLPIASLSVAIHTITLTVTDSDGGSDEASITITVGDQPPTEVTITAPADGAHYYLNDFIEFTGTATDLEEGPLTGDKLKWKTNITQDNDATGKFGTGERVITDQLSPGTHMITLTATDDNGGERSDSIFIEVENRLPEVEITNPANNSDHVYKNTIIFTGTATDPEDGTLSGTQLAWSSDLYGAFSKTGSPVSVSDLPIGTHKITLTATDENGGTGTDTITISVWADEYPSSVTISDPDDGDVFYLNEYINFAGSATDEEDGELTGDSLVWKTSIEKDNDTEGKIGTGKTFTKNNLSKGEHLITLTAKDSEGQSEMDFVVIEVKNQAPVPIINTPSSGTTFDEGDAVVFSGSAWDPEDGTLSGNSLSWQSSIDGSLGVGVTVTSSNLSPGTHTITLRAKDSYGEITDTSISVVITQSGGVEALSLDKKSITVPLDLTETVKISGGYPPYRISLNYPQIVVCELTDDTILVTPSELGKTTLLVTDRYNYQKTLEIEVTQASTEIPVAKAGADQSVLEGQTVTLDGSSSTGGIYGIDTYSWRQTQGNTTVVLSDESSATPTFVAPLAAESPTLVFQLTVTDTIGTTSTDEITVSVFDNGIEGYPDGVTTFKSADSAYNLGINIIGEGSLVKLEGQYAEFNTDMVNRPGNMVFGLLALKIKVNNPGDTAQFILYFPQALSEDYRVYKHSTTYGWYELSEGVQFDSARTKVFINLTDGGTGDDDIVADAMITDPLAIGTAPSDSEDPDEPSGDGGGGGGCFIRMLLK